MNQSVKIRVFENSGYLEIRVICEKCWSASSGYRSIEDIEKTWGTHVCQVVERGGRE